MGGTFSLTKSLGLETLIFVCIAEFVLSYPLPLILLNEWKWINNNIMNCKLYKPNMIEIEIKSL